MKWKLVPVEPTPEMLLEIERQWLIGSFSDMGKREYLAALEAAPQPPALSDERIFDLFLEKAVDKGTTGIYDFARAIERELIGENK